MPIPSSIDAVLSVVEHSVMTPPTAIMGILNCTPDSFSDGGKYVDYGEAVKHARGMIAAGADIIDIGGESTKPGALTVSIDEELSRVIPVIEQIRQESAVRISIDTSKAEVMRAAVNAGATMINDVRALQNEGALEAASELQVPICMMHMQGLPETMQDSPRYIAVIDEINQFFTQQIARCVAAGIARSQLILDPGFGFGKTVAHNLTILKYLDEFKQHQLPLLLGVSRKSTLGIVLDKPVDQRLYGGLAVAAHAFMHGVAMLRTHDVDQTKQVFRILQAITHAN